jgi:metal-responsive CopG/Arc/MetJ family transcriptional regulator
MYDMAKERNTRVITVSLPPEDAAAFDRLAEVEGRNRSEMFREMFRIYRTYAETRTFESLQRYGAARAAAIDVRTEADVERLIRDARR